MATPDPRRDPLADLEDDLEDGPDQRDIIASMHAEMLEEGWDVGLDGEYVWSHTDRAPYAELEEPEVTR